MMMEQEIEIKHIRSLEEFASLKEAWKPLFENRKQKTAFLSWEWLFSWWKNHGDSKELWLLTAWKADRLIGAAPLMLTKASRVGLRYRLLQSLGKPNTDESDFMAMENPEIVVQLFFGYIQSQKSQWDAIEFCELNSESSTTPLVLAGIQKLKLKTIQHSNSHFHIQTSALPWDEYWKSLSKNTREGIEKRLKQGKKKYNLEFQYIRGIDVNWEHFETIFDINQRARYPEKYGSPRERAYLKDLVDAMQGRGWLEVIFLHMDNKPIAYDYGFNMDGRFEDWRTGYDLNYSTQAAGKLLLYLMIKHQFENDYNDFDFLRGAYEYKTQWNPESREYINLIGVNPLHLQATLALLTLPKVWDWVKRKILKRTPV